MGPVTVRLEQARMVAKRIERLSADSAWARIASGYRGGLLKAIDEIEGSGDPELAGQEGVDRLDFLIDTGFDLLAKAAREIGDPELLRFATTRGK